MAQITHVVVCCMDPRLTRALDDYLGFRSLTAMIRTAGGVKHMFDDPKRIGGSILPDVELAVTLGAHTVVVVTHTDCGAYKCDERYESAFASHDADKEMQISELEAAKALFENHFHGQITIVPILAEIEPDDSVHFYKPLS